MLGAIFTAFNMLGGFQGLVNPFPADHPFLEHQIEMSGKFHRLTITPHFVMFKERAGNKY
jgi:hypothetical protein